MNQNEIILAIVAIGMLAMGLLSFERNKRLMRNGKKAKAIIFTNNYRPSINGTGGTYRPVVRFVTESNEWITQELSIGQNPPMKEGKEIEVYYDPENPQDVIMNSYWQLEFIPWVLIIAGAFAFGTACLELTDIINIL